MRIEQSLAASRDGLSSDPSDVARNGTQALLHALLNDVSRDAAFMRSEFLFSRATYDAQAEADVRVPAARECRLTTSHLVRELRCFHYRDHAGRASPRHDGAMRLSRVPASYNFFRQRDFRIASWSDQDLRVLPLAEIIKTEAACLDTHVPLYHAMRVSHWALNHFVTRLVAAANPDDVANARHWLRPPTGTRATLPRLASVRDLRAYLDDGGIDLSNGLDNRKSISHAFLSCNPSIMQNSDVSSEECTADFFYSNLSVNALDTLGHVETLLSQLNPALPADGHARWARVLLDAIGDELQAERGVLYQFLIPHAEVDDLIYISGQNGVPNPAHPEPLETLLQLQTDQAKDLVESRSLQARLYLHPLMDLTRQSEVRLNIFHGITTEQIAAFERRIEPVIACLLE